MMQLLAQALLMLSTSIELSILVKTMFVLTLGLVATRVARGARASTRHWLLAVTLGGVLVLPVALFVIPARAIQLPMARIDRASTPSAATTAASRSLSTASVPEPVERRLSLPEWSMKALAKAGWLAGGMFLLLRLGVGVWQLGRLRRRGIPWIEQRATLVELAAALGVRQRVDVLLLDQVTAPATSGSWYPAIVLPPDARAWSDAEVRRALVHEMEHVRRGDWAIHLMARAVCAAFWFNPLVWVAARRLALEAERACDDAVLQESGGVNYAAQLVRLARRLSSATAHTSLAMANRSDLSTRVSAILDSTQPRGRLRRGPAIAAVVVTAIVVVTLGPARAVSVAAPLVEGRFAHAAVLEAQQPSGGGSLARQGAEQSSQTQKGSLFVVGQVAMPGRSVFTPGVNVRRAIAAAGGFDRGLTETEVDLSIQRQVGQTKTSVPAVLTDPLRPGDTVLVQRKPSGNIAIPPPGPQGQSADTLLDSQLKASYPAVSAGAGDARKMVALRQEVVASCNPTPHVPRSNSVSYGVASHQGDSRAGDVTLPAGTLGYASYTRIYNDSIFVLFVVPLNDSAEGLTIGGIHGCLAPIEFEFESGFLKTADLTAVKSAVDAVIH